MQRRRRNKRKLGQAGSLTVELALLMAFVLMPMLAGVVDFGQYLLAQAVVTRAASQGALVAARNHDAAKAGQVASDYMENAGYDTNLMNVTVDVGTVRGDPVIVQVRYDTTRMVIIPWRNISDAMTQVQYTATERRS